MKKAISTLMVLMVTGACVYAGPPTFDFSNPDQGAASVPVDGGASLLLAAGAGYGIKRLKEKRKLKSAKKQL